MVGRIVYVADLDSNTTYGFGARTGGRVMSYPRGAYNAVVSDSRRIYLTGHSSITALEPKRSKRNR